MKEIVYIKDWAKTEAGDFTVLCDSIAFDNLSAQAQGEHLLYLSNDPESYYIEVQKNQNIKIVRTNSMKHQAWKYHLKDE